MLPAVAADRRQGPCERRHQCQPHPAARHPQGRLGRRSPEAVRRAGVAAAQGRRLLGRAGRRHADFLGAPVPVLGMAGDQQAATVGQACIKPGMVKATYGTGCFALLNTGSIAMRSRNRLLTTIAYQLAGQRTYALEGSIFMAGAAVQWLRDGLHLIAKSSEVEEPSPGTPRPATASTWCRPSSVSARPTGMPARAARSWASPAIPAPAEIAAATLDSVCYQTRDLVEAMRGDGAADRRAARRRRHGGERRLMQRLADTVGAPVERPHGDRDHGAGGGLPGRPAGRPVAVAGGAVEDLGARPRLPAGRGRRLARPPLCRLALHRTNGRW